MSMAGQNCTEDVPVRATWPAQRAPRNSADLGLSTHSFSAAHARLRQGLCRALSTPAWERLSCFLGNFGPVATAQPKRPVAPKFILLKRTPTNSSASIRKSSTSPSFKRKSEMNKNITVVIGAGSIGQAIARRGSAGRHVLLADLRQETADAAAKAWATPASTSAPRSSMSRHASRSTRWPGMLARSAMSPLHPRRRCFAHAGVARDDPEGRPVRHGAGSRGVRQSHRPRWRGGGHLIAVRAPPAGATGGTEQGFATTPTEDLLHLPFLQLKEIRDSLHAYQRSKRGNSLRVMAEAVGWGQRGARVNTISPGIIMTPLAKDELAGPRGAGYRRMIEGAAAGRAGTPDEVATVGALLLGAEVGFITGSDFLVDGGVSAAYWYGDLAEVRQQE